MGKTVLELLKSQELFECKNICAPGSEAQKYMRGKTVLVTGGGGSIGSELCRQLARLKPRAVYILDIYENNACDLKNELYRSFPGLEVRVIIASIRDRERMEKVFANLRPEVVFHAAAHKHVPLMEHSPSEAVKNNVFGTLNTAVCAQKYGAERFVLISTDKAVNPVNVLGATKRVAEMTVQSLGAEGKTKFASVRFGNVFGSSGSVVPLFMQQIENGGPVTLTHKETTRFFMTIPEAARLAIEAASMTAGGEIFVLDMGEPVKIYDLAKELIRRSGYEPEADIKIEITGLRPGEKLHEELLTAQENLEPTSAKKIYVLKQKTTDYALMSLKLDTLAEAADGSDAQIRSALAEIVPSYRP